MSWEDFVSRMQLQYIKNFERSLLTGIERGYWHDTVAICYSCFTGIWSTEPKFYLGSVRCMECAADGLYAWFNEHTS